MHIVAPAAPTPISGKLPPPRSFVEASARVDAALDELRAAERALERQLADLRFYRRDHFPSVPATGAARG